MPHAGSAKTWVAKLQTKAVGSTINETNVVHFSTHRNSSDAKNASMETTSIVPLHFQRDTFVKKDTARTPAIGSVRTESWKTHKLHVKTNPAPKITNKDISAPIRVLISFQTKKPRNAWLFSQGTRCTTRAYSPSDII